MENDTNYVYSDVPISAEVRSNRVSLEELVDMYKVIWQDVKNMKNDDEENDKLLVILQSKYKDFNASFPLVLRWMVQMRAYNPKAFEKYLIKHSSAKLETRQDFLKLQAEYLALLFRDKNKHCSEKMVELYKQSVIKSLLDEDNEFIKIQKDVENEMKKRQEEISLDRRQAMYKILMEQRVNKESN